MRQILQELSTGQTVLNEVPQPALPGGHLLISSRRSLISAGTERMLVEFGRAGLLDKARQQPEKVREVLQKARTDGVLATFDAVRSKLSQPLPLGYCNVGIVTAVGAGISEFSVGDRVVSNGAHAEMVVAPRNLCARIPASVSNDESAFTVLGAIALQGIRLAAPTLGERFVVIGLGLIGLLTVQLLRANGCQVLGIELDPYKQELGRRFGAEIVDVVRGEDSLDVAHDFSAGEGIDGVIITAATQSSEPVSQAARMCRKRGRIILVGVTGLELDRGDFYRKELTFQVSCSYGPGRYDPEYEEKGNDYPLGFVRWTEQRNFQAVLSMMASKRLDVHPLITHRFAFESAPQAYELLATGSESYLGILLEYSDSDDSNESATTIDLPLSTQPSDAGKSPAVGFIGAGNYAGRVLIPSFAASGVRLRTIASAGGVTAAHYGRKFGFETATTDAKTVIAANDIDIVVIATRHNSHADLVVRALQARKHVFVEKPLAITQKELTLIHATAQELAKDGVRPHVMVGFNRRFAPQVVRMKSLLDGVREPKSIVVTVNAGEIPPQHWTQDPRVGGERIIGEGCHFIDLARFLVGQPITEARVQTLGGRGGKSSNDKAVITLAFADGSWSAIHYLANGHKSFPKERVEVFCAGRVLQLDNFRLLQGYGWPGFKRMKLWRQDKGQNACVREFLTAVKTGGATPISFEEIMEVARVTILLGEAARA